MLEFLSSLAAHSWQDVLDIVLVYVLVYRLLLLVRGTRAVQILTGLGIVSVSFIVSDRLKLYVLNYLLKQFFDYFFLVLIILFQDEIRRALANMGRNPFQTGPAAAKKAVVVLEEICKASHILAAKRIGALIALERQHGLKNYTEGSTLLNAEVSAELLLSIFHVSSPIHDGAVIIQGGKVLAAGCFFPLTLEAEMDRNLGTRHRAAIALTQETDALVVVLSEERGEISLVEFGEIHRGLTLSDLRQRLYEAFDLQKEINAPTNPEVST
ncbi:MAG: TIGR00159 family protein [Bdellovibrionales bacterium]|nr:TIGR00159 family protein [Bdellovibrionales bacterium]